jgi:VWFA-related protein
MLVRWPKTIVTACVLAVFAAINSASASDDEFTYRSNVEEVRLTLVATDRQSHYINNLAPSELAIVDNEVVVRKFRSFSRSFANRLNVLLVIDASGSVSSRRKRDSATVIDSIRKAPWGDADSVSVFTFGSGASQFECIRNCSTQSASSAPPPAKVGVTPLYDNLLYGVTLLAQTRTPESKSILAIFSDGDDNYSIRSLPDVVDSLQRIDATAYSIDLNRGDSTQGSIALQRLAGATGGLRLSIDDGPAPILENILNDLRSAYVLTYVPPVQTQGLHAVQVLPTRNLNLMFRTRQGYIYKRVSEEARSAR